MNRFILLVLTLLGSGVSAQNEGVTESPFITYSDKITTGLTYFDSSNSYFLNFEEDGHKSTINLRPNTQKQLIASVDYKLISLSFGYTPNFMKINRDTQKSKQFNLRLQLNYKKWFQSLSFAYMKGYFMDYNDLKNHYFPDLRTLKIGGVTSFVLNERFSYKSLLSQGQWQKKSAGSFVANASYYYNNFDFNQPDGKGKSTLYTIAISSAYYYNWVIYNNFLVSAGLVVGTGVNISEGVIDPIYEVTTHARLGYNTEHFYSFIGLNTTNFTQQTKTDKFEDFYTTLRIGVGYRFNTPKKMTQFYDDTLNKIKK